jgi:hypothetical protein
MESMTYLTSGILDSFSMPVISIESALTKIFATDRLYRLANDCLEIFGVEGIEIGHPVEQYLRDIRPWSMFDAPNDVLRLLTAWEGVMSVSTAIHDFVRKVRNPIHFPGTKLRHLLTGWTSQAQALRAPFTFKHDLWEKVNLSTKKNNNLIESLNILGTSILRYSSKRSRICYIYFTKCNKRNINQIWSRYY